jgi:hypothetical protein
MSPSSSISLIAPSQDGHSTQNYNNNFKIQLTKTFFIKLTQFLSFNSHR